jgi:large subunit ribosomal protein L9
MKQRRKRVGVSGSSNSSIEVLLTEKIESIGEQGEIIRVKPGFARNYLLPQGLATVATEHNKRMVERHKLKQAAREVDRIKELRARADAVGRYSVTLEANANKEGQLYGSVLATDISKALVSAGHKVMPEDIRLEGPLKELGMYTIKIEFHPDVKAEVKVWVVPTASK